MIGHVLQVRENHPRMGGRKLYGKLSCFLLEHNIKMGRDAFFNLLSERKLLIKRRKRKVQTTYSSHWLRKYPNLIRDFVPSKVNQLWVSDITYWKLHFGFAYISLITDAYSHLIVGWQLSDSLAAKTCVDALKMAFSSHQITTNQLTHHSDRGVQYCSSSYVKLLKAHQSQISMTENGDPLENAVAERVNGILKEEYLFRFEPKTIVEARQILARQIHLYNTDRPHMSIGNMTPITVHTGQNKEPPKRLWKNYYTKAK